MYLSSVTMQQHQHTFEYIRRSSSNVYNSPVKRVNSRSDEIEMDTKQAGDIKTDV